MPLGNHTVCTFDFLVLYIFCIAAVTLFLFSPANGQAIQINLATESRSDIVVRFEPALSKAADNLFRVYPVIKEELEKTLVRAVDFRPTVILIKDDSTFRKITGGKNIVAFAIPHETLIYIDYSKMATHPFSLGITLKHEMCHLLLHRLVVKPLPRWFDEGVSQWATGGVAEIIMGGKPSLNLAALSGSLIRLDELKNRFPEGKDALELAYEESKSVVEFIAKSFGAGKIIEILDSMRKGDPFETALYKALSITPEDLERQWQARLTSHISWLLVVAQNIYEIIFFVLALITMYAFFRVPVKRWVRSKHIKEADEEDEGEQQ